MIRLEYTPQARKDLTGLENLLAKRIVKKIEECALLSNPLLRAKPLTGVLSGSIVIVSVIIGRSLVLLPMVLSHYSLFSQLNIAKTCIAKGNQRGTRSVPRWFD